MRVRLTALFLVVLVAAFANGRPHAEIDCISAPYTAWALVRHGSFDVGRYEDLRPYPNYQIWQAPNGQWVSQRTPGNAFAAVPLVAPMAVAREQPLSPNAMMQLGKAAGAICVASAACLFFLVCRRIAPGGAWPATILLAFGTCLFSVASQALWMHGPAVFWLCVALYLLTGPRGESPSGLTASGVALGLSVLARPSAAFFALATIMSMTSQRRWRAAGWIVLGGAGPAAILLTYNLCYFGNAFIGGYVADNWVEKPPVWVGLGGLLIAPSRGVFVYSPALLFAIWGAVRSIRSTETVVATDSTRRLLQSWLVGAVVTVIFYARWYEWRGGWCYGPRFLCETMPLMCLLFAIAYGSLHVRLWRAVATALVALSVAIHFIGVYGHGAYVDWHVRHPAAGFAQSQFDLSDTQIEAHVRSCIEEAGKRLR